jgi:hypothetical protein
MTTHFHTLQDWLDLCRQDPAPAPGPAPEPIDEIQRARRGTRTLPEESQSDGATPHGYHTARRRGAYR